MKLASYDSQFRVSLCVTIVAAFCLCGAIFASANRALAAGYDRSGPWWSKVPKPLFGMAYTAEPSDYNNTAPLGNPARNVCPQPNACKYFDSDFTNSDFSLLWGSGTNGRNDLGAIRNLGMNFIALYDWSGGFCRDHAPFLNAAWNSGTKPLMVTIPISDFNVMSVFNPVTKTNILTILYEAYGLDQNGNGTPQINPAVSMWRIGNEVHLHGIPLANAAEVAKIIINFEADKSIPDNQKLVFTSDVDFGIHGGQPPAISQILALQSAFSNAGLSDIWHTRYIASINTTNPASFIENYVQNVFPNQGDFNTGAGLPMFFTEYGLDSNEACKYEKSTHHPNLNCNSISDENKAQADYEQAEFQAGAALAKNSPTSSFFYGFSVFQWQDAFWKCPNRYATGNSACTESLFGIQTVGAKTTDGEISGGRCGLQATTYPVNAFDQKPIFADIPGAIAATTPPTLGGKHKGKHKGLFKDHDKK